MTCESLQMLPTVSQFLCFMRSLTCFLSLSALHQDNYTFENEVSRRAVSLRGSSAKEKKKGWIVQAEKQQIKSLKTNPTYIITLYINP